MTDMVERVARAMADEELDEGDGMYDWYALTDEVADGYRVIARAAIKEMREPTDAMLQALHEAMFVDMFNGTSLPMLGAGFEAAIDAALQEEGE